MANQFITIGSGSFNPELDWALRSGLSNMALIENFSSYGGSRGALLTYYKNLDIAHSLPQNGVKSPYFPWDSGVDDAYADPPPGGRPKKLDLVTTPGRWLTGGASLRLEILEEEGYSEAGPVLEYHLSTPNLTEYYVQEVVMFDEICLSHDFQGNSRKIGFLNDFGPSSGQIVPVLHLRGGPWPAVYRYAGSAKMIYLHHGTSQFGRLRQIYGALNLTGSAPTNTATWDQKYGPSRENFLSQTDPNLANVYRPIGYEWFVLTWYINLTYFHPTLGITPGMLKMWASPLWQPPQLQILNFRDCDFRVEAATSSLRDCWRPEYGSTPPPGGPGANHGIWIDQKLCRVGSAGIPHPGNHPLTFPGTEIPPGHPIAGTHDAVGD